MANPYDNKHIQTRAGRFNKLKQRFKLEELKRGSLCNKFQGIRKWNWDVNRNVCRWFNALQKVFINSEGTGLIERPKLRGLLIT